MHIYNPNDYLRYTFSSVINYQIFKLLDFKVIPETISWVKYINLSLFSAQLSFPCGCLGLTAKLQQGKLCFFSSQKKIDAEC